MSGSVPSSLVANFQMDAPESNVRKSFVEREPLQLRLFSAGDDVYVIPAAQAVIEYVEQAVCIGRVVNSNHFAAPLQNVINKTRRLMAETVVVISPGVAG